MDLKNKLTTIYKNEFNEENYIPTIIENLNEYCPYMTKNIFLNHLINTHQHGYLGFHLIKGKWPIKLLEEKIKRILNSDQNYFMFKYCEDHDYMCIYIDPYTLDITPYQCSIDTNGNKLTDFCFDIKDNKQRILKYKII
jgi:hypothetical protein